MNSNILDSMLEEFDGCEGSDPGTPEAPSIWLFGIEPGKSIGDRNRQSSPHNPVDEGYTVEIQRKWPYNRNAFKLFAAMSGHPVTEYLEFAHLHKPFVAGSKGYFKGNLYPYACRNVSDWPDDAAKETGLKNKAEYQEWCRANRWIEISKWVSKYRPRLFIGVGTSCNSDFSIAVFGREVELDLHEFSINGAKKKLYYKSIDGIRLVVIPHLSRGLHEHASLKYAGEFIATNILNSGTAPA